MNATPRSEGPSSPHARLFTKAVLDTLEARVPSPVDIELEEYDKELEERLFPLDDVELRKRVVLNTTKAEEPSLEELSALLNLPMETLRRTSKASPGELSTPEYWLDWYKKTLAASAEAKRANRDFRASSPTTKEEVHVESGLGLSPGADSEIDPFLSKVIASALPLNCAPSTLVDESRVIANIGIPRPVREHKSEDAPLRFDCSSLAAERYEALGSAGRVEDPNDILNYVCFMKDIERNTKRKPGLMGVRGRPEPEMNPHVDVEDTVPEGKRVICSVEGFDTTSAGFIDGLPAELLIDTGAIASPVDSRVLENIGLVKAPLRPYRGSLNGVSGQPLHVRGEIELPLRLGTLEKLRTFAVIDRLHVHALLGTDTLKAFRAVIDMDESMMTLKETGETIRLALVVANLMGTAPENCTVLMEGLPELDPILKVARSLCCVQNGQTIIEVCNASGKDFVTQKGTALAAATVVPGSAFHAAPQTYPAVSDTQGVGSVMRSAAKEPSSSREAMPGLKEAYRAEREADFAGSKLSGEQQELLRVLLGDFRDTFVEASLKPGRTDLLEFSIDTGTNSPIKLRPHRVSNAEGEVMEAEIDQYLNLGLIRPSTSPWASPVLMIRKPDGGIRFCIYYRRLNAVTIKDCYPMPLIDDILDVLKGANLYSTMDIASGYWNVPMDPASVEKTAFTCKYGLFEWLWRTCLVYLDDCVVFSSDFPTHLVRLRQVLERFRNAGFKLMMKKCRWGRDQVAFLGHIVTPAGILPNPEKLKAGMNVVSPHDLHSVRAFLGLTSYFRRYIPGYTAISAPIERLKVKGAEFVWNADCEAAFFQLKRRLVEPPILVYPDFSKRFKLYVDSSRLAVGACLMQTVDGSERVTPYASKLLVGSEKKGVHMTDGTSKIECWGIARATRKLRCYLDRTEFHLYTDHKALTWVFNERNRTANTKLARWAMELSQLRFKVYHKPGTSMGHVDGLSRLLSQRSAQSPLPRSWRKAPIHRPPPADDDDLAERNVEQTASSSVDVFGLDQERFRDEQKRTPWIQALAAFRQDGTLALDAQLRAKVLLMAPHYVIKTGVLMRRVHLKARGGPARSIIVLVIPLPFIETVLHYCHSDVFAAHVGQSKTMDKVRKHAYWHGRRKDVAEYVRTCTVCGNGKGYRPWKNGLMQRKPVQELSGPFSLLLVDAFGPLVTTPRGHKYILVFADYFTRWVEAFPAEALDTISFVRIMVDEVLCRHGVPERLLSDRDTNFISELAKAFYEPLGIKKLFGAAYHPQTQGLVERFNDTLIGMLRMFVSKVQSDWDLYLPRVLFAYCTSYHDSLGDTPFFSLDTRRLVERQLLKAQDRNARRRSDQVVVDFEEGDAVWVYHYFRARRDTKKPEKLAFSWHGPYRVVVRLGENTYKIAIPNHPDRVVSINVNRLKKFAERWSRPFPNEIPLGVERRAEADDAGPLTEGDLPSTSFVERLTLGGEETGFSGVSNSIVEVLAKRIQVRREQYLVLMASYELAFQILSSTRLWSTDTCLREREKDVSRVA
ncbi:unnamed protein product [Phytophthora fragariaefolia]|uniref:RNA-directed DNA polymerase n=1 Tax=Phytophthora fragariaefolia TaxID=1490495 RepID=A0A9W6Y0T8_9STRA|nr:unnamed protein product [Phytophthora fragariaefolia]